MAKDFPLGPVGVSTHEIVTRLIMNLVGVHDDTYPDEILLNGRLYKPVKGHDVG